MSRLAEIVLFATMSMLPAGAALSQQTLPDLVGTWKLVLVDNVLPDGTRIHLYGPNPHGLLVFDITGLYALEIMRWPPKVRRQRQKQRDGGGIQGGGSGEQLPVWQVQNQRTRSHRHAVRRACHVLELGENRVDIAFYGHRRRV
jgi:hypothetical protein